MNINLSYMNLERKIQDIKYNLNNLCFILDQYRESSNVQLVDNELCLDNISVVHSLSSYHTARDSLSISSSISYVTALDELEFDEEDIETCVEECKSQLTNTLSKKTVSFSKYVTILEVFNRKTKQPDRKEQLNNFKGKFVDYIYREKFYIQFKWQKLRRNIFKSNKRGKDKKDSKRNIQHNNLKTNLDTENQTKTIDLKWFFQEIYENSLLETDVDENSITIIKESYAVPLTDLDVVGSPKKMRNCFPPLDNIIINEKVEKSLVNQDKIPADKKMNGKVNNHICFDKITDNTNNDEKSDKNVVNRNQISENKNINGKLEMNPIYRDKIKIQPKLYNHCDSIQKSNGIENNLLLKYLISKAHYPIQLKIATSIVKLNLPLWYQSSLIV